MKTLFELKQSMATIGQQLQKIENELADKAMDTTATLDDVKALQTTKSDLKMRFDVIKEQHDQMEAEQKAKFENNQGLKDITDPKQKIEKAKADLIRAAIRQQPVSADVRQALGDNTNPATGGEKFLPKTVSTDIITEPLVKNPLREVSTVTNITNLEIPKLNYTLDDDDFIADTETAKELKADGDVVTFTRHKFKVFAGLSETVLNGSDANLVGHTDNALRSGLAAKEKKVTFATTPKVGEEHMSFYSTQNGIAKVSGENMYKAIKKAIADLHEDYRENAKIVMRYQDYSEIIETLANGNATLYSAQPEQILGKPVIFCDSATKPIVGDFSYSHYNYDLNVLYDRDKDVKTGIEQFVLTAWIDHRIKLKSAFRIAEVTTP
ncbi:HK97 family phage major capsid protein [Cytobacillus horneckiae]|uniref:phage major capsid protein n=1 Tax=Cytobacillus horneckiae TaxID=549687 RepID=UPI0019D09A1D|nr:phage major capsid protein [Cytobacillus horneckiae]MBN6887017.1 phage major capsid protein [Cytobacillus horneckiae]